MWVKGQIAHRLEDATGGVKDLLARNQQPHLFDRLSWFQTLLAHNDLGGNPLIVRTWTKGARAWLFLTDQGHHKATALANYYTLAFRPIFTGDPDPAMRRALLVASARRLRNRPIRLAQLTLAPVPQADGSADLLARAFRSAGWLVFRSAKTVNWTVNVAGKSFDQYWAERPGALRSTFARKLKKSDITTEVHTAFDPAIWAEYESIYAESWKPEEGSTAFLKALAQEEGAHDGLRMGIARLDGVAVAAQFWTIEPGRAVIHKLAYRTSAAALSPGTILTATMFRHVIDTDKVDLIDYGTGDDRYKADWMDTRTIMEQIDCLNPIYARSWIVAAQKWLSALARADSVA